MENKEVKDLVVLLPILMSLGTLCLALWLLKGAQVVPLAKSIFRAISFSVLVAVLWLKYREKQKINNHYLVMAVILFIFFMAL